MIPMTIACITEETPKLNLTNGHKAIIVYNRDFNSIYRPLIGELSPFLKVNLHLNNYINLSFGI